MLKLDCILSWLGVAELLTTPPPPPPGLLMLIKQGYKVNILRTYIYFKGFQDLFRLNVGGLELLR